MKDKTVDTLEKDPQVDRRPSNDAWEEMADSLRKFSSDFMEDRAQPEHQERNFVDGENNATVRAEDWLW